MHSRQLPLDLGETPVSPSHLWTRLPVEHQLAAVAALARLIAQVTICEEKNPDASTTDFPVA
jgi:hypothetical protein